MSLSLKRWWYLCHRWLGIGLCLLFAMWFASGIVMMYVGYPKLTVQERLLHLPRLEADAKLLSPQQALTQAGWQQPAHTLRLARLRAGQPVYIVTPVADAPVPGQRRSALPTAVVLDARTGQRLPQIDAATALASAAAWAGRTEGLTYLGTVQEDAATHSRALDAHRPLHKVALPDRTWLYVSHQTGEVVRDAPHSERFWNYAGAWIHWLYPLRGGALNRYWSDIVNTLSLLGIASVLTGLVVGLMRWRFGSTYRNGRRTPYPSRIMRWHHIGGLFFAGITLTWIFSGLMSMNPWRIFNSQATPPSTTALHGAALTGLPHSATPLQLLQSTGADTRELVWTQVLGTSVVQAYGAHPRPQLLHAHSGEPYAVDTVALRAALPQLLPAPLERVDVLYDYDLHYYARTEHTMTGGRDKPLPIWRVVFADSARTWVHLDPHTATVINSVDSRRRTYRWLFAMLHSWDWLPLLERRPLWDAVLVGLSLGGLLLSSTGAVIGWRRLRRRT